MHTLNSTSRRPVLGARGLAVLALVVIAIAACSDPFKLKAQYANEPFDYSLYSISGNGPANAPAALDLNTHSAVRLDGAFAFDVAFDLDGSGKIVVIPQKLVGVPVSGSRQIGLQRLSGTYEAVASAPTRNWQFDSTLKVLPGEPFGVRLTSVACAYQISNEVYAKVVIDSVRPGGLIFGRGVMNPNCGFKSFGTGIPTF